MIIENDELKLLIIQHHEILRDSNQIDMAERMGAILKEEKRKKGVFSTVISIGKRYKEILRTNHGLF